MAVVVDLLQDEIDKRAREIHTDRYSMSLSEVVAMYGSNDLETHPEFQRIFRWSIEQQSRLIESIFLGIPVPPIFVAQRSDGVWDVVDGVQRLSTIFRFMGVLKDDAGKPDLPFTLTKGEYLEHLDGVIWDEDVLDGDMPPGARVLSDVQRRVFKRARLDFQIVQKESDETAKFDLFQRLNSGTRLSEQEARNCLAVMLDNTFAKWIEGLTRSSDYDEVMAISERKEQEAYGMEGVLRYLACARTPAETLGKMGDFGEFLTNRMRDFITDPDFDRTGEEERFSFIFSLIRDTLGDSAFKRYDPSKERFAGKFSISAFEAITSGLARNLSHWHALLPAERGPKLEAQVKAMWSDDQFNRRSGSGWPANRRIPHMIEVGTRFFKE